MERSSNISKILYYGIFFLALILSFQNGYSQTKTRVLIKGIVKGTVTKEPLPGANIVVVGTSIGTTTNLDGEYSLFVSLEKFEIRVSYLGNKPKIIAVEVNADEMKIINVDLEPDAILDEVVIRGALNGQQKALNQQRASDNLKNVVSSDQIGSFPDQNTAESLQRVQGINVQRDEGDGRFVLVRGLAPQFTNISINGEQIPSPEGDSRFVALDAIPSNQLASLEVSKSITPDMDGDAIGGSVNLITPSATKTKLTINGSAGLEYNNASEKASGLGSLSISKRSENEKFGFIISGSLSRSKKNSNRYEFDGWDGDNPGGLDEWQIVDYEIERDRIGMNATFDYKISDRNKIYLRTFYSKLKELEQRRRTTLGSEEDEGILEYELKSQLKYRPEDQGVYSVNLGGTHESTKLKLDYEVAVSKAFQETSFKEEIAFENAEDVTWDLDITDRLSPQLTSFTYDGVASQMNDPSQLEFDKSENEETLAEDVNITGKFHLSIPINISENPGELKFGGKIRLKNKTFEVKRFRELSYEGSENLMLNSFSDGYIISGFMDGELIQDIGPFADRTKWNAFQSNNLSDFEEDTAKALEEKTLQEYDATENVYAAYVQGKIQLNKLMILGGLRYEKTNFDYTSGTWNEEDETASVIKGTNDYDFLLPMLHLKYSINENNIIRGSITKSYSRPNFVDLVQGATFNEDEASISNPDLKPVKALNVDLFSESYFGSIGLLSGGVFYKKLNDFIYQQTTDRDFGGYENIEVTQSVNGDDASLIGFEIGYQQNLSFLPGFLKGFVVYLNYTHSESKATVKNFSQGEDLTEIDLPGTAENVGNGALAYNYKGFKARLSVNYIDSFISEFDGGDIVLIEDRTQVDFSMSQTFSKNKFVVFVELINLTDANQIEIFNTSATPKERQRFGRWGRLGLRFNF